MKLTTKSLLMLGLLLNGSILFPAGDEAKTTASSFTNEVQKSYNRIRIDERNKRLARYGLGLGVLAGIGGLIYYAWQPDINDKEALDIWKKKCQGKGVSQEQADIFAKCMTFNLLAKFKRLKQELKAYRAKQAALPWYTRAKNNVVDGVFSIPAFCTTLAIAGLQSSGLSMLVKGVLNPLAEKLTGMYSVERFIATKTKLNQNIKDLIRYLVEINKDEDEISESHKKLFNITFSLLEKDIINVLGFMAYIYSFINKDEALIRSKAILIIKQVRKSLLDLGKLKTNGFDIEAYKTVLSNIVDQSESFEDISMDVGTDLLEDLYASTFDQLRQAINSDVQPEQPNLQDLEAFAEGLAQFKDQMGQGLGLR